MFMQFWQLELFTNFYRYAMPYTIFYVNSENAVKSVRQRIMPNMCINFLIELLLGWRLPDFSSHLNLLYSALPLPLPLHSPPSDYCIFFACISVSMFKNTFSLALVARIYKNNLALCLHAGENHLFFIKRRRCCSIAWKMRCQQQQQHIKNKTEISKDCICLGR